MAAAEAEEGSLELAGKEVGVGTEGTRGVNRPSVEGAASCSLAEIPAESGAQVAEGSTRRRHPNTGIEGGATGAEGADL